MTRDTLPNAAGQDVPEAPRTQRFEDLIAWQRARRLASDIYRVSNDCAFARDFGLRDQIRRAAVSVMSNIAEGFEHRSPAEFGRFLAIAKASCAEVRSQLYVALDIAYITRDQFKELMNLADETARVIEGLRRSTARYRASGTTRS